MSRNYRDIFENDNLGNRSDGFYLQPCLHGFHDAITFAAQLGTHFLPLKIQVNVQETNRVDVTEWYFYVPKDGVYISVKTRTLS